MKLLIKLSVCIFIVACMGSCIKDKGTYDIKEINKIAFTTALPDTFNILVQQTLTIDLDLAQSMPTDKGLSYDWVLYPGSTAGYRIHISDSSKVRFFMTEEPRIYDLDLFITDKATNISTYRKFYVNVSSVFNQGWLVMEEFNGKNDIAIIRPNNSVERNIYSKSNENELLPAGKGKICVFPRRTEQIIYFLSSDNGVQVSPGNFGKTSSMLSWFFINPGPIKPLDIFAQSTEEHFIAEGKAFGSNLNAPSPYGYGVATVGDYYLAPYMLAQGGNFIFYDTIAQRFWSRPPGTGDFPLLSITESAAAPWSLNKVGKRLLYAGLNNGSTFAGVFESNGRDSLFVLKGLSSGAASVAQTVDTLPAGMPLQSANAYLASRLVPHIYFAKGNQLFVWDIPAKSHRLIYTFPVGTDVRTLKWYNNTKSSTDADNNRVMMAATQEGGEGKLYLFPVELTGDFTGGTYRNVFTGFGQIRDVTYKTIP
ncbi:MAG: PKD-like family lipoprotein [Pseudobacter sp.]|uniref:PKD-like family lipoprotein n=1 Tax=Pseudobacter sp. TaxID=2045420 RepID=UPI003F7FCB71